MHAARLVVHIERKIAIAGLYPAVQERYNND